MTETERLYRPHRKHPALFDDVFAQEWLHPDMVKIVKSFHDSKLSTSDPLQISPFLRQETEEVYSFSCMSPTFISMFNEEIENFYTVSTEHKIPVKRPNSMNNYGVVVNTIGMRPIITSFQQLYVWPLAKRLFPKEGAKFDDHHSFIVKYQADEDLGLDMHVDDSDVTFNVCLGHDFTGATLSFCGNLGRANHRKHVHTYHHEIGRAVMHLGSRRHGADDIASGSRANLIVWNQNHAWRESPGYQRIRSTLYEREDGPPDAVCLSYTHDRDYSFYKELPKSKKGQTFSERWCPPEGREYKGFHEKMMEQSPMGDL
eukprot:CAMPEP_0119015062 /NCGR_PEP_ID=MMETSP1176-20130426/10537_1 /TAXON_ID=265551 /ORGANISM="Synedropsis recta cf, Strain CCMP1620" /LENGTH=314 /DNA_ID=CAMNT_0006968323 /DNA_START=127 /DNA_END=1071 /DNA_ORIENTATION=-